MRSVTRGGSALRHFDYRRIRNPIDQEGMRNATAECNMILSGQIWGTTNCWMIEERGLLINYIFSKLKYQHLQFTC